MEGEIAVLEIALTNLLEELKEIRLQQVDTVKAISVLKEKVEGFEQKVSTLKITTPPVNTFPITSTISEGIEKIKSTIEKQPKSITKQFRILLFPEYHTTEYYKIVFGRILFWSLAFLTATYLFALGQQYIQVNSIVNEKKLENDNVRKAWIYLYKHNGKALKNKMDSAYLK